VSREFTFERFTLQPARRQLQVDGRPAKLGPRAFDVLCALVEARDRPLSKTELMTRVWPTTVVADNNLEVHIWALRKVLGARAIATIPGHGYRFALPVDDDAQTAARRSEPGEATPVLRTNLPERLPPLIGRAGDIAALDAALDECACITLTGAGGIGKTSLAQHLLDRRRNALPHGVCWVDLAEIDEAPALAIAIASAVGVPLAGSDPLDALAKAMAPLSLCLALDNADQIATHAAVAAERLLGACPGVRLLVTSQVPLESKHERVYRLGPLAVPSDAATAKEAMRFGAVELFVERARAVDPRFVLRDEDVALVGAICRQLDGSALAIELAAARMPVLGLPRLAESLCARLQVLTKGRSTSPARQQTLRGALEWSYGLLDDTARTVFRRMAVFAGGCSIDLVHEVVADDGCDRWQVLEGLDMLVDRSLVAVLPTAAPRYRMLESPRALALELLAQSGEETALRARHARAVGALFAASHADSVAGLTSPDAMQARLADDLDNARAALAWMLQHDRAAAVELARPLSSALTINRFAEIDRLFRATEACLDAVHDRRSRAQWALGAALHYMNPQPEAGHAWAQRAVELSRELDDPLSQCRALCLIAQSRRAGGEAMQHAALDEVRRLVRPEWPAVHRMYVAKAECLFALHHGDLPSVEPALRRWLRLAEQAGSELDQVAARINLADLALSNGDPGEAVRQGRALERTWRATRAIRRLAMVRMNLAAALLANDDPASARDMATAGWPLALPFDLGHYWADSLALLAAMEQRPRAAAMLRGYSDAAYAARVERREPNEARTARRADAMARDALGDAAFQRWREEGRALGDGGVAAIAFSRSDIQ